MVVRQSTYLRIAQRAKEDAAREEAEKQEQPIEPAPSEPEKLRANQCPWCKEIVGATKSNTVFFAGHWWHTPHLHMARDAQNKKQQTGLSD